MSTTDFCSASIGPIERSSAWVDFAKPHQGSTTGKHGITKSNGDAQGRGHYFTSGVADKTAARWASVGVEKIPNRPFPCVLDGHDHDAFIHPAKGGHWLYSCSELDRELTVAGVRAMIAYGDDRRLSAQELSRWLERVDWEAGLRHQIPLDLRLPGNCPRSARDLAESMALFVGLRDLDHFRLSDPFVWATHATTEAGRRQVGFGPAYATRSIDQILEGRKWLEGNSVLRRAGKCGRAIEWKLAAQDTLTAALLSRRGTR